MTTAKRVRELLDYDPETGVLTWRINRRGYRGIKAGDAAGGVRPDGYRIISINGQRYYAHRLAFLIMEGRWPANEIDHINGAPDDNRWCNLREVNHQRNHRNQRRHSNNTSGRTGVNWDKRRNKWRSYIGLHGRTKFLGRFDTQAEAVAVRRIAEHKYGFHVNHGRAA